MIVNASNTIYNILLQSAMLANKKYYPLVNTTLNEKFEIYPDYMPDPYVYPTLNLVTIGIGNPISKDLNILNFKKNVHNPIDGALYTHAPLLIKPIDEELTSDELARYRLRVKTVIGDKEYHCFYGIKISDIIYENKIKIIKLSDVVTGTVTHDTFTDTSILNPSVGRIIDVRELTDQAVINIMKVVVDMDPTIVTNMDNAIKMLYNLDEYTINEIGICAGIDTDTDEGYTESMWTQINYFISTDLARNVIYDIIKDNKLYIDVGGVSPILYNG